MTISNGLSTYTTACVLVLVTGAFTIQLDLHSKDSIINTTGIIASDMLQYYTGDEPGQTPGLLPSPYYWWEAGAMWGSLIDYWYYTGDSSHNELVTQALLFQVGPEWNYMPPNQTRALGNDDQAFWGLAAMSAAEVSFPNPPEDEPQWLALAQAVFDTQAWRWNTDACGGGLKWQIYSFNMGYTYRNTISNGAFFNLAARLGAYTRNATYFHWANKAWDWSESIGLIGEQYQIYDGSDDEINCTDVNHIQWSYNMAVYLHGAAVMWNQTAGSVRKDWTERVNGLLVSAGVFFEDDVMAEISCEPQHMCNLDQQSFKAYAARWMAATTKVAPWTYDIVKPLLSASALAAADSCTGGDSGRQCGTRWTVGGFDGLTGVGQQMNALEVIQSNLIDKVNGPLSSLTGGTSQGTLTDEDTLLGSLRRPPNRSEKIGAKVLTVTMVVATVVLAWLVIVVTGYLKWVC